MIDFKLFKSALGDYSKTLRNVRNQIDATEVEIEDCLFAPVAKEDAKKAFRSWIESEAGEWRKLLFDRVASLQNNAEAIADPSKLRYEMQRTNLLMMGALSIPHAQGHCDAKIMQRSLFGMFEEPMWKAIEAALDGLTWPPNAITVEARTGKLKALNEKLSKLKDEEAQLVNGAKEVGIDPSGVE